VSSSVLSGLFEFDRLRDLERDEDLERLLLLFLDLSSGDLDLEPLLSEDLDLDLESSLDLDLEGDLEVEWWRL